MAPRAVLMKTGLKSFNTARPVNTVRSVNTGRPFSTARSSNTVRPFYTDHPKSTIQYARPRTYFQNQAQSTVHRPFSKRTTFTKRCFNQKFDTGRPFRSTVNTVKASACWVWMPKNRIEIFPKLDFSYILELSITFRQDAPSTSFSLASSGIQPPVIQHDVVIGPTNEDTPITQATLHPSNNPVTGEPGSTQSSSGDVCIDEPNHVTQPPDHLRKWSKDHPLDNIDGNPSRPVSTRK
ncbi:hypothetical protein Tco_0277417 [Tanacetum coccineum]